MRTRARVRASEAIWSLTFSLRAVLRRQRFDGNRSDHEIVDRRQLHGRWTSRLEERREIDAVTLHAGDQRAERPHFAGIEERSERPSFDRLRTSENPTRSW